MSGDESEYIVDDDSRHVLAHFGHRAAEMRREDDVFHFAQGLVDLRLALEHVKPGAGNLPARQGAKERRLVNDGATRGVDEERGVFHQAKLAGGDLMPRFAIERRMDRDEVGLAQQLIERRISKAGLALLA